MTRYHNCTLFFVEHAQAKLRSDDKTGSNDKMRMLTPEGRRQAIRLMEILEGTRFDEVIVSTAVRTQFTAGVIVGDDDSARIHDIESMYGSLNPVDHQELLEMFGDLGHSKPLAEYLGHKNSGALRRLSAECAHDIQKVLGGTVDNKTLLFVGHPVLIAMLIYNMFEERAIKTLVLTHVLGECGVIRVSADGHCEADAEVVGQVNADSHSEAVTAVVN